MSFNYKEVNLVAPAQMNVFDALDGLFVALPELSEEDLADLVETLHELLDEATAELAAKAAVNGAG